MYKLAAKVLEDGIENNDEHEEGHFEFGKALYRIRRYMDAVDAFERCIELNPNNTDCKKGLKSSRKKAKDNYQDLDD